MSKKFISTFTCTAAIASSFASIPAFAEGTIDGVTYWDAGDLAAFNREIENEQDSICGDNADCALGYRVGRGANPSDVKYQHLAIFNNSPILVTSINPAAGKIKYMYHGIGGWERMQDYTTPLSPLNRLYVVWLGDGASDPRFDNSYFDIETEHFHPYYMDEVFANDFKDYTHLIYSFDVVNGDVAGTDWDTEFEIDVPAEHNLLDDPKHTIFFYSTTGANNYESYFDYTNCLADPAYEEGMECRIIYKDNYESGYAPFTADGTPAVLVEAEEPVVQADLDSIYNGEGAFTGEGFGNEPEGESRGLIPDTSATGVNLADSELASERATTIKSSVEVKPITPKTPDTGEYTEPANFVSENLVWLIALGALSVIFIAWWLIPAPKNRRK